MTKVLCGFILLFFSIRVEGQPSDYGKSWVFGAGISFQVSFNGIQPVVQHFDTTFSPVFSLGNSSICDSAGNLILASDGMSVYNKESDTIDGGYKVVPNEIFQFEFGWSSYAQSSIFLPIEAGKYYFITATASDNNVINNWIGLGYSSFDEILVNTIDMNANGGAGKVTKRMVPILKNARLSKSQMMACRHGDGKSWWLLKMAQDTNMIYKFLLTADSIYGPEVQGFAEPHFSFDQGGQSVFTKDGSRFATTCRGTKKIFVADFDRCTGLLSAPLVYNVSSENAHNPNNPGQTDEMTEGLAFSPNGQYLYVAQHFNIRQLDLLDSNPNTAWSTVAGLDTTWDQFPIYSSMYLGPDDKLYLGYWSNMGGSQSYFDFPDNKGAASGFCRRCLRFPGIHNNGNPFNQGVTTPPSMPNYKLGAASPICWPTEVKDVKVLTDAFKVYPNPTNGELTAEYDWPGVLEILDVYGRIVHSTRLGESCRTTSISIAHLQSGLYLYNYRVKGSILHFGKLLLK